MSLDEIEEVHKPKDSCQSSSTASTEVEHIMPELYQLISFSLLQLVNENHLRPNFKSKVKSQFKEVFSSKNIPHISLSDYLYRIIKYTKLEDSTLINALVIIDRLLKKRKILLNEYNIHRILFTAIIISIKCNEDKKFGNPYYAKVGGIDAQTLFLLEKEFVIGLQFDLFVDVNTYYKYLKNIIKGTC